jgi:hypothetical protein
LDKKYRAIFICLPEEKVEIVAVTKHYHKWKMPRQPRRNSWQDLQDRQDVF